MATNTSLAFAASAAALVLSAPAFSQSTETPSLNYERVASAQAGVEPDEVDARNTAANSGLEPDEIDVRATDGGNRAGLLLPAVQAVRAADTRQSLTPVFIEIDDIEGESANTTSDGQADLVTAPGVNQPQRARRRTTPN
ncbi:hypothetical protein [Hyphobacterium marinum]|uniref:Uncharacterized protein n=1 Tax=Hyphobacterium marinum TaxID=3116574 RepID=A0ABU7LXU3_9PROT|nr:hypothetical protein [Hyphobacterium sp. Y6023]MEE2566102.1 hypothetical protein [Hyphobacterium sp. Y6023]